MPSKEAPASVSRLPQKMGGGVVNNEFGNVTRGEFEEYKNIVSSKLNKIIEILQNIFNFVKIQSVEAEEEKYEKSIKEGQQKRDTSDKKPSALSKLGAKAKDLATGVGLQAKDLATGVGLPFLAGFAVGLVEPLYKFITGLFDTTSENVEKSITAEEGFFTDTIISDTIVSDLVDDTGKADEEQEIEKAKDEILSSLGLEGKKEEELAALLAEADVLAGEPEPTKTDTPAVPGPEAAPAPAAPAPAAPAPAAPAPAAPVPAAPVPAAAPAAPAPAPAAPVPAAPVPAAPAAPAPAPAAPGSPVKTTSSLSKPSVARDLITKEEGLSKGGKAYYDPPKQTDKVSVGYGHQIKEHEYKQGYLQAGDEQIPIKGTRGIDTVVSKDQAAALLEMDMPQYTQAAARPLGEAWGKLNDEQKAALVSYAYNTGSTRDLVDAGLKDAILAGDMQTAASIIAAGKTTAGGKTLVALEKRRQTESQLFAGGQTGEGIKLASVSPTPTTKGKPQVVNIDNSKNDVANRVIPETKQPIQVALNPRNIDPTVFSHNAQSTHTTKLEAQS